MTCIDVDFGTESVLVYADTRRGQRVVNVLPWDASADRVRAAAIMVQRRRAAWDRLGTANVKAALADRPIALAAVESADRVIAIVKGKS